MWQQAIASLFAAFIMMLVGIQVIIDTFKSVWNQNFVQPDMLTAWTALAAAFIMLLVYVYNLRLSKAVASSALHAAAQDNRSDALVSIGVLDERIGHLGAVISHLDLL